MVTHAPGSIYFLMIKMKNSLSKYKKTTTWGFRKVTSNPQWWRAKTWSPNGEVGGERGAWVPQWFSRQLCPEGETQGAVGVASGPTLRMGSQGNRNRSLLGAGEFKEENQRREDQLEKASNSVSDPTDSSGSILRYTCAGQAHTREMNREVNHRSPKVRQNVQSKPSWADC